MKKFPEIEYKRVDIESVKKKLNNLQEIILEGKTFVDVKDAIDEYYQVMSECQTMFRLCEIRYSIDVRDKFYEEEFNFNIENEPLVTEYAYNVSLAIFNSKYKDKLKLIYGDTLFHIIECRLKSFSPEIVPLLVEEGKLVQEYDKLVATGEIEFQGKILNTSEIRKYFNDKDRNIRKKAQTSYWKFFESISDKIDDIYSELVLCRDTMAKKLGFDDYVELGYLRLGRYDYTSKDVCEYREEIIKHIVPLVKKIRVMQKESLGLDHLMYYDLGVYYKEGNPTPSGSTKDKINAALKMYKEMSPETEEFSKFMFSNELVDLEAKKGKQGGGYCSILPDYGAPFVFSNFNGSSGDVDVLTHEFGHAFQVYKSREFKVLEYLFPTLEACEIHSMSMEFFAYPWMELFFKDKADKYKFAHLAESFAFMPYGASIDAFQEEVYKNPHLSPRQRKDLYRKIEKKYLPGKVYDNLFLEKGNFWIRQQHIFSNAFYYIDYTIAQNCAHQFFMKNLEDRESSWEDYLKLCKKGGSLSFLDLITVGRLFNPLVKGPLIKSTRVLGKYLEEFYKNNIKK